MKDPTVFGPGRERWSAAPTKKRYAHVKGVLCARRGGSLQRGRNCQQSASPETAVR